MRTFLAIQRGEIVLGLGQGIEEAQSHDGSGEARGKLANFRQTEGFCSNSAANSKSGTLTRTGLTPFPLPAAPALWPARSGVAVFQFRSIAPPGQGQPQGMVRAPCPWPRWRRQRPWSRQPQVVFIPGFGRRAVRAALAVRRRILDHRRHRRPSPARRQVSPPSDSLVEVGADRLPHSFPKRRRDPVTCAIGRDVQGTRVQRRASSSRLEMRRGARRSWRNRTRRQFIQSQARFDRIGGADLGEIGGDRHAAPGPSSRNCCSDSEPSRLAQRLALGAAPAAENARRPDGVAPSAWKISICAAVLVTWSSPRTTWLMPKSISSATDGRV